MKELWTMIGLCCVDDGVRNDLFKASLSDDPEALVRRLRETYNFQASVFETEELRRLLTKVGDNGKPSVVPAMERLQEAGWIPVCPTGYGWSGTYQMNHEYHAPEGYGLAAKGEGDLEQRKLILSGMVSRIERIYQGLDAAARAELDAILKAFWKQPPSGLRK